MPGSLKLLGAYPNPFNPRLNVAFEVLQPGPVRIAIHDLAGRLVRTLAVDVFPTGVQRLVWNGTDDRGNGVASGTYLLRLEGDGALISEKVVLLR